MILMQPCHAEYIEIQDFIVRLNTVRTDEKVESQGPLRVERIHDSKFHFWVELWRWVLCF